MSKIKVAVVYGGRSAEHEVSCMSAAAVLQNLDRNLFEPIPIAIDKNGRWLIDQEPNVLLPKQNTLTINTKTAHELPILKHTTDALPAIFKKDKMFDAVFPVVHGVNCEDGTLQGLFELLDIPYVGPNLLSSAIGMDKDVSKRLAHSTGIAVAPCTVIRGGEWRLNADTILQSILEQFTLPLFVKPCNTGSSVGVTKVRDQKELINAIEAAFQYDQKVIVEVAIDAREVELAALENAEYGAPTRVSVAGEVVVAAKHEFYSYTAKYLDPEAIDLVIPLSLAPAKLSELQETARQLFSILECEGMARVDFLMERGTDKIYFNEINTIPGFTPYSMYPKLWEASGLGYQALLTELIRLSIARHERKQRLKRDWL